MPPSFPQDSSMKFFTTYLTVVLRAAWRGTSCRPVFSRYTIVTASCMNAGGKPHWDKRVNESTAALLKSLCDSDLVPEDSLRSAVKANGLVGQQPDQDPRSVIHNFVKLLVPTPTAAEVRVCPRNCNSPSQRPVSHIMVSSFRNWSKLRFMLKCNKL